jgi:hypothetical protein
MFDSTCLPGDSFIQELDVRFPVADTLFQLRIVIWPAHTRGSEEIRLCLTSQRKQPVPHKHPYERSRQAKASRHDEKHLSDGDIYFGGLLLGRQEKCAWEHKRLIHDSPISMQIQPAENHERGPGRFVRIAVHQALDIFATSLGTRLRGIKRWAKTLNLLRAPGTVRPPPLASTRNASSTTCSGLW